MIRVGRIDAVNSHAAKLLKPGLLRVLNRVFESCLVRRLDVQVASGLLDADVRDSSAYLDPSDIWVEFNKSTRIVAMSSNLVLTDV